MNHNSFSFNTKEKNTSSAIENNRLIRCSRELYPHLSLEPLTGILTLNKSLDHELCAKYSYTVRASDVQEHRLSSLVHLQIHVADVNDNPIKFVESRYMFRVLENVLGDELGTSLRINLTDADSTHRAALRFRLESEEARDQAELERTFELRQLNTESSSSSSSSSDLAVYLVTRKPLDYELKRRYFFRVVVTDELEFTDTTQVEVD